MAKATKRPIRQQRIPGTIDAPTEAVVRKAEQYVEMLQHRMTCQEDENGFRAELIELMQEAKLTTFTLDTHTVTLTHSECNRIVVKKVADKTDGD